MPDTVRSALPPSASPAAPPAQSRRRRQLTGAVLSVALTLALGSGRAGAGLFDKEVRFSEAEVQARVDQAVPPEKRYGEWLAVRFVAPPRVTLGLPQPERVGLQARAELSLLGQPPVPVDIAATAGIRYDDAQKAFFLEAPQVEQVASPALDPAAQPAARRALSRALAAWYASRPIHVLRSDASPQEATARWLLRSIRIEPGHVVAVLSPL